MSRSATAVILSVVEISALATHSYQSKVFQNLNHLSNIRELVQLEEWEVGLEFHPTSHSSAPPLASTPTVLKTDGQAPPPDKYTIVMCNSSDIVV